VLSARHCVGAFSLAQTCHALTRGEQMRETQVIQARRLTTILPAISLAEALDTPCIRRGAGLTDDRTAFVTVYPASV
jgi:hypothetical protein